MTTKTCDICGLVFTLTAPNQRRCSDACKMAGKKATLAEHRATKRETPPVDRDLARKAADRLFADETFKPQWMERQEQDALIDLDYRVTIGVENDWRRAAAESREAIAAKYPCKQRRARLVD